MAKQFSKPKRSSKGTNFRIASLIREGASTEDAAAQAQQEVEYTILRKNDAKRQKALGK